MAQTVITIDATVGGASSNSFLTLADADVLLHTRPFHSAWDDVADNDQKKASLVWATRILSSYKWKGYIADQDQALSFPRTGLYDMDDREYESDSYPEWLLIACSELAFIFATEDRTKDSGTEGFSSITVGPVSVDIDKGDRPKQVPDKIVSLISPWLYNGTSMNAKVLRV